MSAHPHRAPTLTPPRVRWRVDWSACRPFSWPVVAQTVAYALAFHAMRHHADLPRYAVANVAALVANVACRAILGLRREAWP